mgnify:CR=1 FL=1
MVTIAVGCMIGGPMSPTGGARNALMIGFLGNMGIDISSHMKYIIKYVEEIHDKAIGSKEDYALQKSTAKSGKKDNYETACK